MNYNTKLFFKINGLLGRNKWLDAFSRAGAMWLLVFLFIWYIVMSFVVAWPSKMQIFLLIAFFCFLWCVGTLISAVIGVILKKPRPYKTFDNVNLFYTPLSFWKTFPSDHAMTSFLIFFTGLIFHLPFTWSILPLALWVCWGRVYAGVHYPFDIAGGLAVASLVGVFGYYLSLLLF